TTQAAVYLHAAHARQIVSVFAVEQALEQSLDGVLGRRLTGAHHAVNGYASGHLVSSFIGAQRLRNIAATIQVVNVQGLDFTDIGGADFGQYGLIDFVVGVGNDFTRFRIDHALGQDLTQQEVFRYRNTLNLGSGQVAQMLGVDTLVFFDDDCAGTIGDVDMGYVTLPALRHEFQHAAFIQDFEVIEIREVGQDGFGHHAYGFEQNGYG